MYGCQVQQAMQKSTTNRPQKKLQETLRTFQFSAASKGITNDCREEQSLGNYNVSLPVQYWKVNNFEFLQELII